MHQLVTTITAPKNQKYLISSCLRSLIGSNIICLNLSHHLLYRIERKYLDEVMMGKGEQDRISTSLSYYLEHGSREEDDYCVLIDPASVCLRNPDHLWPDMVTEYSRNSMPDVLWMEDRKERLRSSEFGQLLDDHERDAYGHRYVASPGVIAIRSSVAAKFWDVWQEVTITASDIDDAVREKVIWNKVLVILAKETKQRSFERGEVIPLREGEIDWDEVRNACIVSVSDWKDKKAKEHFLRCLYFGHFFGDESGLMLNILDP